MKYQAYIFDMDGTLADTSPGVFEGVRRTMQALGEPPVPEEQLGRFIGPPLWTSFRETGKLPPERVAEAVELFRGYYSKTGIYESNLYPGMRELLTALQASGAALLVATLKLEGLAQTMVKHVGLDCFTAVVGADPEGHRTKRDTIALGMELAGVTDPKRVLMIGDSEFDAIGAAEAGVDFCAALYGFGLDEAKADLHPCVFKIREPLELLEKLGLGGGAPPPAIRA